MTWEEYCGWQQYAGRYPFGPEESYQLPAAQISAAIQNANGGIDGKPARITDNLMFRPRADDDFERAPHDAW